MPVDILLKLIQLLLKVLEVSKLDDIPKELYFKEGCEFFNEPLPAPDYFRIELTKAESPLKSALNLLKLFIAFREESKKEMEISESLKIKEQKDLDYINALNEEQDALLANLLRIIDEQGDQENSEKEKKALENYIQQLQQLFKTSTGIMNKISVINDKEIKENNKLYNAIKKQCDILSQTYDARHSALIKNGGAQLSSINQRIEQDRATLRAAESDLANFVLGRLPSDPEVIRRNNDVIVMRAKIDGVDNLKIGHEEFFADEKRHLERRHEYQAKPIEELIERQLVSPDITSQQRLIKDSVLSALSGVHMEMRVNAKNKETIDVVSNNPILKEDKGLIDAFRIETPAFNMKELEKILAESNEEISDIKANLSELKQERQDIQSEMKVVKTKINDIAKKLGKTVENDDDNDLKPSSPPSPTLTDSSPNIKSNFTHH